MTIATLEIEPKISLWQRAARRILPLVPQNFLPPETHPVAEALRRVRNARRVDKRIKQSISLARIMSKADIGIAGQKKIRLLAAITEVEMCVGKQRGQPVFTTELSLLSDRLLLRDIEARMATRALLDKALEGANATFNSLHVVAARAHQTALQPPRPRPILAGLG